MRRLEGIFLLPFYRLLPFQNAAKPGFSNIFLTLNCEGVLKILRQRLTPFIGNVCIDITCRFNISMT